MRDWLGMKLASTGTYPFDETGGQGVDPQMLHAHARVKGLLDGPGYQDIIRRAAVHEPEILKFLSPQKIVLAPFHDALHEIHNEIRSLLPVSRVDTVICVPWLRTGGADLVACLLADALGSVRPNERILILRTDSHIIERPDWLPPEVASVDLSAQLSRIDPRNAEYLFFVVLMGLAPRRVINVNSRICWQTLARFGSRLGDNMSLYSYLFCWDQTPSGERVGYPEEFFSKTAPILDVVFTDTDFLRRELIERFKPTEEVERKVAPLYSPARSEPWPLLAAEVARKAQGARSRPVVLWAGRLDRQKRFDIVLAVAQSMPDVDFTCWGSALLDRPPDLSSLPRNLTLYEGFKDFNHLPLTNADIWLFTSDWEGMPTTIVELAIRGMPIVGTAVGGVPELLDDLSGWPVPAGSGPDAYVREIRRALASPDEAVERARALQQKAMLRYTKAAYQGQIEAILDREVTKGCT